MAAVRVTWVKFAAGGFKEVVDVAAELNVHVLFLEEVSVLVIAVMIEVDALHVVPLLSELCADVMTVAVAFAIDDVFRLIHEDVPGRMLT